MWGLFLTNFGQGRVLTQGSADTWGWAYSGSFRKIRKGGQKHVGRRFGGGGGGGACV